MSLRTNNLVERIRDLRDQSARAGAPDQAARAAFGREVLQALGDIDRVATTAARGSGPQGRPADGAVTEQLRAVLAGPSPVVCGVAGHATTVSNAGARNAASLVGTTASSGSTSHRARRA